MGCNITAYKIGQTAEKTDPFACCFRPEEIGGKTKRYRHELQDMVNNPENCNSGIVVASTPWYFD